MLIDAREEQCMKTHPPMIVTETGTLIAVSEVHSLKVSFVIFAIDLEMMIYLSDKHPLKALL
jgi:hypothetical protein